MQTESPTGEQKEKMKKGKALEQVEKAIQEHLNGRSNNAVKTNEILIDIWGIKREIDVLIYPKGHKNFGIAFECRDHKRKVGLFEIDSFIGKYHDLSQIKKVIVVSTSGFTKDAQRKAEKYNIGLHTIENLPYEEILKCFEVIRLRSKVEILLPLYIQIEGIDTLVPYLNQKVYVLKDDAEVPIFENIIAFMQKQISTIQEKLSAMNTNTGAFLSPLVSPEKWYILDGNNNKQIIREWRIATQVVMDVQEQGITEQKFDMASSMRISEWTQTDVDDLVLIHDAKTYSVFRKDKDGNIKRANVVPQYSI